MPTPESDRAANGLDVTSDMRQAGADVIEELRAVVSSDFLAERVYVAMACKSPRLLRQSAETSTLD